jgi:putative lipoprotein
MVLVRAACALSLLLAAAALAAPPVIAPRLGRADLAEMVENTQLQGPRWALVELGGAAHASGSDGRAHLTFQPDGRFSGSAGCNRVSGAYTAEGAALTFGAAATTRMACKGDVMQMEDAFLRMLEAVSGWRVEGGRLHLLGDGGQTVAIFGAH